MAKIRAIEEKSKQIEAGVEKLQEGIQAQVKENEEAVTKIEAGVEKLQEGIQAQVKAMKAYIHDFYYG